MQYDSDDTYQLNWSKFQTTKNRNIVKKSVRPFFVNRPIQDHPPTNQANAQSQNWTFLRFSDLHWEIDRTSNRSLQDCYISFFSLLQRKYCKRLENWFQRFSRWLVPSPSQFCADAAIQFGYYFVCRHIDWITRTHCSEFEISILFQFNFGIPYMISTECRF